MLRHHVQKSAADAKRYYQLADYLTEGQAIRPEFGGKGAAMLGVEGSAGKEAFERLCDNRHPVTGEQLTARTREDRIVGIDLTFDGSKGFAVIEALAPEEERARLARARLLSELETLEEMERAMAARVRKGGRDENRTTGNMLWYRVSHDTSRPVDGVPDMNPHEHYFVLNATWDDAEKTWKAANLYDILRDMPYYQAAFQQRHARRLQELGYPVERKGRFFEAVGIPRSVIDKFSRRTEQIKQAQKELGITDPELASELGARTREKKARNLTPSQLRRLWISRLTKEEREAVAATYLRAKERERDGEVSARQVSPEAALEHAAAHVFERKSSAPAREVLAEALAYGVGGFSVEDAWRQLEGGDRFTADVDGRLYVSSRAVLAEEDELLRLAREGRGTLAPVNTAWNITDTRLGDDQRAAVAHLLSSTAFVTMVVGDPGAGKSTAMAEAQRGAAAAGLRVFAFAPSAAASRINLAEDFPGAETVATLMVNEQLQEACRGQILLIDEAALMGTRETADVFRLAKRLDARVWVVGDEKQSKPVNRGSPFELLQGPGGIVPARLAKIRRQRKAGYRKTVELARTQPGAAFRRLREMGWVREVPDAERYGQLAADYLELARPVKVRGKWQEPSVLVVAPTHAEGARVTAAIRAGLREQGKLGEEREFVKLTSLHLTEAQRADPDSYEPGTVLQFTQNCKGHGRGERVLLADGVPPPVQHAAKFAAYRPGILRAAVGDRLRITANGQSRDGHRLTNGDILTVAGFDARGDIIDHRGWHIPQTYGHLASGYTTTSVSAQSRSVDHVLIAMGRESLGAVNREQLLVSLSRGRHSARIYTDDANRMERAVEKTERRVSATELAARREAQQPRRRELMKHVVETLRRRLLERIRPAARRVDRGQAPALERGMVHDRA